jgi:uncharacterized repeat protein (TIGR03803 family)
MSRNSTDAAFAKMPALLFLISMVLSLFLPAQPAQAQAYQVIHNFTGGADGASPFSGLTIDAAGNLYGTAEEGGTQDGVCSRGCGTVFQMKPLGSGWVFSLLDIFPRWTYGSNPYGGVIRDAIGNIYGTSANGGRGAGNVFKLTPSSTVPRSVIAPWTQNTLYQFNFGADGKNPYAALTLDAAGNLYGTTLNGGDAGYGTVFELAPFDGGWAESVIHSFAGGNDGANPYAGVVLDSEGNLYGTTPYGGAYNCGVVFQLSPSGSDWAETIIHSFRPDDGNGCNPLQGVILDTVGNLYGTTNIASGYFNYATVFELTPSDGRWGFTLLYTIPFPTRPNYSCYETGAPAGSMAMDGAGNLYGTTQGAGEYGYGSIFKLTQSNGTWNYTTLHNFQDNGVDGFVPCGGVTLDASGKLYGTTFRGGPEFYGTVFEITP